VVSRLSQVSVVVAGLEFGAEFVPIYQDHPAVRKVAIADLSQQRRTDVAERFGIQDTFESLDDALRSPQFDAVHIVTGLDTHADHVIAALRAGKHAACTVPMGLSLDELARIIDAQRAAGTCYMMMETAVFTRQFLWAREQITAGALGEISYARGTHFQDMTDWPAYWLGLPPMYYATHAVSPILALLGARATAVRATGGGTLHPGNTGNYDNNFPVESAHIEIDGRPVVIEITRSLFQVARPYTESFSIYGEHKSIEWPQLETSQDEMMLFDMGTGTRHRGRPVSSTRIEVPDRADLLPASIRRYTRRFVYGQGHNHLSFIQGGGHGGSHPHMVHEFVTSVTTGRKPIVDAATAANWTATGIAAHRSAQLGGERVPIPDLSDG
jgi:predicted dehydrogenase